MDSLIEDGATVNVEQPTSKETETKRGRDFAQMIQRFPGLSCIFLQLDWSERSQMGDITRCSFNHPHDNCPSQSTGSSSFLLGHRGLALGFLCINRWTRWQHHSHQWHGAEYHDNHHAPHARHSNDVARCQNRCRRSRSENAILCNGVSPLTLCHLRSETAIFDDGVSPLTLCPETPQLQACGGILPPKLTDHSHPACLSDQVCSFSEDGGHHAGLAISCHHHSRARHDGSVQPARQRVRQPLPPLRKKVQHQNDLKVRHQNSVESACCSSSLCCRCTLRWKSTFMF